MKIQHTQFNLLCLLLCCCIAQTAKSNDAPKAWINGEEVSGGSNCKPASGYLCIESEGAPIDFKNLRLRLLP